ncbi:MAG TPA: DUF4384 domain-containing protein [Gemmatimonadales bacterium]|nr:DUF4384 domain-containing protein [Gemmatimonadales bacterium]
MLTAMLLGTLAFAAPATDPDPAIRVWFDQDESYRRGERVKVMLKTRDDRYVVVFHVDPDNRLRVLFPLDPGDDNYVRGGKKYKVIGRGGRDGFVAEVAGRGIVFAAASADPFRFDEFTRDQYWDYRQLNASPLEGDVEQALVELVQRMSTGRFEYDIIPYSAYADASELAPPTDAIYDAEPALASCLGCRPNTVVVVGAAGPAWCGSPLYDPLCYDPYYYSPGWVPPAYWNTGWGYYDGWYGGWYGGNWHVGGGYYPAPYPPAGRYPFNQYVYKQDTRRWSDAGPGYRPRGDEFRNVNTVAGPLPSTGRTVRADPRRRIFTGAAPVPVVANAPTPAAAPREEPGGGRAEPAPRPRERAASTPPRREWSGGTDDGGSKAEKGSSGSSRDQGGSADRARGGDRPGNAPSSGASSRSGGDRPSGGRANGGGSSKGGSSNQGGGGRRKG